MADFNGDGNADMIVTHCCNPPNYVYPFLGNGDGTFTGIAPLTSGFVEHFSTAVADFNGDGKPDLVYSTFSQGSAPTISAFLNITATVVKLGTLTLTSSAGAPLKLPPVAPYSIATAKGTDLGTAPLFDPSAPNILLGTTATVKDSLGVSRPAGLFYVSAGQVNFLVPKATALGNAVVTITSGDGFVSVGTVSIAAIAPALFTLNSNSLVAAYVQRVHGDGTQSIENVYGVDSAGNVISSPIDLGPPSDQVYLQLFGTGIQGSTDLTAVAVTVGNAGATAFYAGPSTYPGEDQVAILLPRSLVGAGTVNINVTVKGNSANTTTVSIK